MTEQKKLGRPKKEETTENAPELTHTAVSILKNSKGEWFLVRIKFNEHGDVSNVDFHKEEDKYEAIYNFKIAAANEAMPTE
jgi:hypothetical protein